MSNQLTVLNNTAIGGVGVNFDNRLFRLKPATLTIVQPNSQAEGAVKGNLRVAETGDQFQVMECALLVMPKEQRQWYLGEPGELNRSQENLMCFSTDMAKPHKNARMPQAVACANCSKSDWGPYREYKEKNPGKNPPKILIPSCDAHYVAFLIDTVYQLPLKMYIRAKGKVPFEQGMQNLARTIAMAKAKKLNPNIYDVKFKLSTKFIQDGKYGYYLPSFSDFKFVDEEERVIFGAMYDQFTSQQFVSDSDTSNKESIADSQKEVDKVVEGEYIGDDKEIVI